MELTAHGPRIFDHPGKAKLSSQNCLGTPYALILLPDHTIWKWSVTFFGLCYVLVFSKVEENSVLYAEKMHPDPLIKKVFLNQKAWEELSSLEAFRDLRQIAFSRDLPGCRTCPRLQGSVPTWELQRQGALSHAMDNFGKYRLSYGSITGITELQPWHGCVINNCLSHILVLHL